MLAKNITFEAIEIAAGVRVKNWHGKCYTIACSAIRTGLIKGRAVYGHYLGKINLQGYWGVQAPASGFVRHGWVVLKNKSIFDPTRWSFENVEPYFAIIKPDDPRYNDYDEGGNRLRARFERPSPEYNPDDKAVELNLKPAARKFVLTLLEHPPEIKVGHVFWLANLSLSRLEPHAKGIYSAIIKAGHGAYVPIDNRTKFQLA
jgi:hypothetical protein